MRKTTTSLLAAAAAIVVAHLIAGCGEEDVTSIKLSIGPGGKGKMVVTRIRFDKTVADSALQKNTSGVAWKGREVGVVVQEATFSDISKVDIVGIRLAVSGETFRLVVPLGRHAKWTKVLAPSKDDIEVIDSLNEEQELGLPKRVGRKFKFTVRLPGKIISEDATSNIASGSGGLFSFGSKEETSEATLVLPVEKVRSSLKKELIWKVTWQK